MISNFPVCISVYDISEVLKWCKNVDVSNVLASCVYCIQNTIMALTHSSVYSISPGTPCLGKLCNICFHNSVLASSKDKHKGPVQT